MATRFYLGYEASNIPGVDLPIDPEWETTGQAQNVMLRRVKRAQAIATKSMSRTGTGPSDILMFQGMSDPLDVDQTISGTISGVARMQESNSAMDAKVQLIAKVLKPDGTYRGILYGPDIASLTNEFATGLTTRLIPRGAPVAVNPVAALAGDRIVVELGCRIFHAGSNVYSASISLGDNAASDHTLVETETTAINPWIEFSQDITFEPTGIIGRESLDIITKTSGNGRLGRVSLDAITKTIGRGRVGRLSMDVLVPHGMPNAPQLMWGSPLVLVPEVSVSGKAFYAPDSSEFIPWVDGTVVGDLIVIQYENGWTVGTPSGFTENYRLVGGNGSGMVVSKIMTSADILAGGVTITATGGSFPGAGSMVRIRSATPSVRAISGVYTGAGFTSLALASPAPIGPGEILLWMVATRITSADLGLDRGIQLGETGGSNASSAVWYEQTAGTDPVTATFTSSGSGSNRIVQAVIVAPG